MTDWLDETKDIDFEYDAVESSGRRKSPKRVVQSEDKVLKATDRKVLNATVRDSRRNFAMTRWVIQKHIDFVVEHNFQPNTGNDALDEQLRQFFVMASKKENFDASGRHSLMRYLRLAESARIVDGDFFSVRLRGGYLQAIESDRVRDPDQLPADHSWVHGVEVGEYNRPLRYSIHRRHGNGGSKFEWERNIMARRVIPHGFYDRFDQIRGVSPLASAINSLIDLYESFDYALAKAKVAQLFALAITRDADWGFSDSDGDDDDDGTVREVNFNKGPQILDMDAGEDAKFLHADAPGTNTEIFWETMTSLVLKSLNIPYSFWDEAHTNFFGSRSSLILYLRSVRQYREDIVDFLNEWFSWRLKIGVITGEIELPVDFEIDPSNWKWIPVGLEYWNPQQEATADITLIESNLRTREEIRNERYGDSWEKDVLPQLVKERDMLREANLVAEQTQPNEDNDERDDDANSEDS